MQKPKVTFNPTSVQVGDTYTLNGTGFKAGALVRVSAIYDGPYPGWDATVDEDGEFSGQFTAENLGADTEGNKWTIGKGKGNILTPGEVLHVVFQLEKKAKNKPFLWVKKVEVFLTVT